MRCLCSIRFASSWLTPSRRVKRFSCVISSEVFWRGSVAKRTSRLVRMPTSLPGTPLVAPVTTGMPENPWSFISAIASDSMASGPMVKGLTTMPDSYFLTCRTWAAWPSTSKLRWMTPTPPACAIAIAMRASVTVSIAEATIGVLSGTPRLAVPADRLHHLPVPAVFSLHVDRDHRVRRGHQQQDVENQPEKRAKHHQDQVEDRRKGLPVQEQPERRQQSGQQVDHRKPP